MAVVTITRQFGAGGSEVARRVAQALGWSVVDNEFVDEVSRRAGLPAEVVAAHEERAPSLRERVVRALALSSPEMIGPEAAEGSADAEEEKLERITERVIGEAAQQGRVVLVGRGAQYVLARNAPAEVLNVWVTAPRADRVRTVAARLGVAPAKAEAQMDDIDAARDRYVAKWHARRRQDPTNYHLVVNTAALGYDGAAAVILAAVHHRDWH